MNILEKYKDIPNIAKWKALITEYGIDLDDLSLFNQYKNIDLYKVKYRILNPISNDFKVFDQSKDESIIPSEVIIDDGNTSTIVKIAYRNNSPFLMKIDKNRKIYLIDKSNFKKISLKITLIKRRKYQDKKLPKNICNEQSKLNNFIEVVGLDRLTVLTFDGCWNWSIGKSCQFCDLNPKRQNYINSKPTLNTLIDFDFNLDSWWKFYRSNYLNSIEYTFNYILKNEKITPHQHLLIMSGNLPKPEKVWDISLEIIKTLNKVSNISNFDNYLNVCPHPNIDYLKEVKKNGIKQVQYNLEVIGAECFKKMCPGKCDYQVFVDKLCEAVKIMGFGKVRSNFVLGIQPVEDLLVGIRELAKKGVVADYSIFQPKRCTPLENHLAPKMETIVYFTKELAKIYKEFGFKGIYCNLGSRSSIINEFICAENTIKN